MRMAAQLTEVMARAVEAVAEVARHLDVSAAFLFGSQVEGGADEDSDIDIAVFARGVETWNFLEYVNVATRIQTELHNDIELHFFSDRQLQHCEPASFAAYVQKHGVRVDESAVDQVAEQDVKYRSRETDS